MNLKQILMELGNELVLHYHYSPPAFSDEERTTKPILEFTQFLNACPEARTILSKMGVQWPME